MDNRELYIFNEILKFQGNLRLEAAVIQYLLFFKLL